MTISKQARELAEKVATYVEWIETEDRDRDKTAESVAQLIQSAIDERDKEAREVLIEIKASIMSYSISEDEIEYQADKIDAFLKRWGEMRSSCKCPESDREPEKRDWFVETYKMATGRILKPSRASVVFCLQCGSRWKTTAAYVERLQ